MVGHHRFHNVKRTLNILHEQRGVPDTAFLAIGVEKAFVRVEWPYSYELLGRFGLGQGFCKWISSFIISLMQK